MLRAVLTLAGTAAGLAALLSFKTHVPAAADAAPATPSPSPTSSASTMSITRGILPALSTVRARSLALVRACVLVRACALVRASVTGNR